MLLRKDDPWIESLPIPDIRNWRVVDENGARIGFVETLMVDPQEGLIEAIYTGANDRFPAESIEVGNDVVRILATVQRNQAHAQSGPSRHVQFDRVFREHFTRHYGGGHEFDRLQPAYQFGREVAGDADFSGRSFLKAEEDLKARFRSASESSYAEARPAIEFAYELVRSERRDAHNVKRPATFRRDGPIELVAGAGFEPATSGL